MVLILDIKQCTCFLILQGVGGHANDGGDTTASSNSILFFDTVGRGGGGTHTAAASRSAKCRVAGGSSLTSEALVACACLLILQGVGGHANDGGDTIASSNSILFFDTVGRGGGGTHTAAASRSAKCRVAGVSWTSEAVVVCACFLILHGVGGHATDGGDTTASSNSILFLDTVGRVGGGTHTAAASRSAKCCRVAVGSSLLKCDGIRLLPMILALKTRCNTSTYNF